jgi:hypothetical protein
MMNEFVAEINREISTKTIPYKLDIDLLKKTFAGQVHFVV